MRRVWIDLGVSSSPLRIKRVASLCPLSTLSPPTWSELICHHEHHKYIVSLFGPASQTGAILLDVALILKGRPHLRRDITVLSNPAKFTDPYVFRITFECMAPLEEGSYRCLPSSTRARLDKLRVF